MNIVKVYNTFVFYLFVLAPFVGFITLSVFDMGYYNMMSALTMLSFILVFLTSENRKIVFPKYSFFLLMFFLYTLLSDIFLANKNISINYLYQNRYLSSFIIIIVIENTFISFNFIKRSYLLLRITMIVATIIIIFQQVVAINFFVQENYYENYSSQISTRYVLRLPSIFSWTSVMDIGTTAIPFFAIIIAMNLYLKKKKYWIWLVIGIAFSFLTKARWIMLGMIIISIMIPIYKKLNFSHFIKYSFIVIMSVFITFQGLKIIGIDVTDIVLYRILEVDKTNIEKKSAGTRILAFKIFLDLFPQHPIFGKGMIHGFKGKSKDTKLMLETKGRTSQIHVGFLSLFYYYGIIGGLLYLLFIWYLVKSLLQDAKKHNFWGSYFGVLLLVTSNFTLVSLSLFYSGYIVSLIFNKYYKQRLLLKNN